MIFNNRKEAGSLLAAKLENYKSVKNLIVLGIPRGGVIVGKEIADFLGCPLDVIIAKKIGVPNAPELALGAVGLVGEAVIDEELVKKLGIDEEYVKNQIPEIKKEVERREREYRAGKPLVDLKEKTVILTDDGVATGATISSALEIIRQQSPKKIVVVVPVIAKDSLGKVEKLADEVIYLEAPELFFAVGQFYRNFEQITDEEVVEILNTK